MNLGTSADGRLLTYDEARYEFKLGKKPVSFDEVCTLDRRDWVRWRAPELREWFVKLDRAAFLACHEAALAKIPTIPSLDVIYRSSNPSIASVDAEGRVVVHRDGVADILAAHPSDTRFTSAVRLVSIVSGERQCAREVRESFKAKGGKLSKAKSFKLPKLASGAAGYEKVAGADELTVTAAGKVEVAKGTKRGLYTAEVAVRSTDYADSSFTSVLVSVEVR